MIIDKIYEAVVLRLTRDSEVKAVTLKLLLTCCTNPESVSLVYDTLKRLNFFPEILDVQKDLVVATNYRNHGNTLFSRKRYHEALQYYNLSLLNSPADSENYVLSLTNRTAVLVVIKKYDDCINNIDYVLKTFKELEPNIKQKLLKRLDVCKSNLRGIKRDKSSEIIKKILQFKENRDEIYRCASSKIAVVYNDKMGRHVIAKEDIAVGEIIAEEEPYVLLSLKSQLLFCCNYCISRSLNLLPCESCCFALYCSEECKTKAWKEYHRYECPLMPSLINLEFTKLELLGLRVVLKSRTDSTSWQHLLKTIEEAEEKMNTDLHGLVVEDKKLVYDSKYYEAIHMLESNVHKRDPSDLFQKCVTAAVFLYMLKEKTDFLHDEAIGGKVWKSVGGNLLHHIMTCPTNMHGLSSNIQTDEGHYEEYVSLASAPYAFMSLLNHSCAPNVTRFSQLGSGKMTLIALRPIEKGMQLFDNYGPHHALESKSERQKTLQFQYKFTCSCDACIEDWPNYLKLMTMNVEIPPYLRLQKAQILSHRSILNLQAGSKLAACELYGKLLVLAEKLDPYYPCMELCDVQESMKQCLVIFEGVIENGFSKLVDWSVTQEKQDPEKPVEP